MAGDDDALLARCLAGDQDACTDLVNRHARMVGTIIWRATGDNDAVEDLAQETFLRVFRALAGFRRGSKLSTWVCTIAHRVAIDHVRQVAAAPKRASAPRDTDESDRAALLHDPAPGPEALVSSAQLETLLRHHVAELPDPYRLAVTYASIDGLDYDTIAAMLGVPVGTVKTHVFRGKQQLRERLAFAVRAPGSDAS